MDYEIRRVMIDDIDDFLRINTEAWNESYKGIIDKEFLEWIKLNLDNNIERLKNKFDDRDCERYLLIYKGMPVGMSSINKSRIKEYCEAGELSSLYLLDRVKGIGFGKILFMDGVKRLRELGFKDMVIGCLKENKKANGFYKHMGGELVLTRKIIIGKQELDENIYYYKDIMKMGEGN